jgi:hypothetical protein
MADKSEKSELMNMVAQALAEARAARIAVDDLRGKLQSRPSAGVSNAVNGGGNVNDGSPFVAEEFVALTFIPFNPDGPAPYIYTVLLKGTTTSFILDPWEGRADATGPAASGMGRYSPISDTEATPEVVTTDEKFGSGGIPAGFTEETLTFVLDNMIIPLTVLVKDYSSAVPAATWTDANDRELLQVMPYGNASAGKLRLDLGYLKAPSA